jgi:hypothetical protein
MNVHIGPTIRLPTQHGEFDVLHVTVQDGGEVRGPVVREGVVLRSLVHADESLVRVYLANRSGRRTATAHFSFVRPWIA